MARRLLQVIFRLRTGPLPVLLNVPLSSSRPRHPPHSLTNRPRQLAPAASETAPATEWYGWEQLASDAGSTLLALGALGMSNEANGTPGEFLAVGSAGGYLVASPLIHSIHGHPMKALLAVGLRLALPALTGAIGYSIGSAAEQSANAVPQDSGTANRGAQYYPAAYTVFAIPIGMAIAMIVDDGFLAREEKTPAPARVMPTIEPRIVVVAGGATAGVGGTF